MVLSSIKEQLEKASTIKTFAHLPLGSELKKDQINVNNTDREDGRKTEDCIKTENVEIIGNMHNRYIDDKYKDLINNIFTNELKDGDLLIHSFDK